MKKLENLTNMLVEDILNTSDEDILMEPAEDSHLPSAHLAYALLWRSPSDCPMVQTARKVLLGMLSHDEQREAIRWVINEYGPMSARSMAAIRRCIAADIRAGVFPRKSIDIIPDDIPEKSR